jgi:hypothetical protein
MSVCEYDRPQAVQLLSGPGGIRLPVEVRQVDDPTAALAVFGGGVFEVAQPQIARAASQVAHVRVVM